MSALAAACFAAGASAALAQEKEGNVFAEDDATTTLRGCKEVGCNNGPRMCGEVGWVEPDIVQVGLFSYISVPTYHRGTCYEIQQPF